MTKNHPCALITWTRVGGWGGGLSVHHPSNISWTTSSKLLRSELWPAMSICSSSPITHPQQSGIGGHQYCFFGLQGEMLQQITNNLSQYVEPTCQIIIYLFISFSLQASSSSHFSPGHSTLLPLYTPHELHRPTQQKKSSGVYQRREYQGEESDRWVSPTVLGEIQLSLYLRGEAEFFWWAQKKEGLLGSY